jgi:hypothetical protein
MIDTVNAVRTEGRRHRQCLSHRRRHSHRLVNVVIIIHVILISFLRLRHPQMTTQQRRCHWTTPCHWWALVPRQGREVMSLTAAVNVVHIILPTTIMRRTTTATSSSM